MPPLPFRFLHPCIGELLTLFRGWSSFWSVLLEVSHCIPRSYRGLYLHSIFTAATALTIGFPSGSGVIWLNNVQCNGNESRLIDCPASQLGFSNCGHSSDVGVACSATSCTHGDVRLVNKITRMSLQQGMVEICINNIWGRVCSDDGWRKPDAEVTCRQLGLQYTSM